MPGDKDIYGHSKNVKKSKNYLEVLQDKTSNRFESTFTTIDKAEARYKRGLLYAGFNEENLLAFQSRMLEHIDMFCDNLGESSASEHYNAPKNMIQWCEFLTLDVTSDFVFRRKTNTLNGSENRLILDMWHKYNRLMGIYVQMPWISKLRLEALLERLLSCTASQIRWNTWLQQFIATVLDQNGDRPSGIFSAFLTAKDKDGQPLKRAELWAEGSFLMLAGSDTTATALAASFYYLSHFAGAYTRAATEVRTTFSHSSEIRIGAKLQSCEYLSACIAEAMRISPSVAGSPYREVLPGGLIIDGVQVPQGVDVAVCGYALHHHPLYFRDPETFDPERWMRSDREDQNDMSSSQRKTLAEQHIAYSPFSIGPRSCPGRSVAMKVITLALAKVLWHLDFIRAEEDTTGSHSMGKEQAEAKEGSKHHREYRLRTHVTATSDGPMLKFKKREVSVP
ncbi:MAG: hypothetical protein Q9160_002088 [Pyrenula sp. 1 TL-2023]